MEHTIQYLCYDTALGSAATTIVTHEAAPISIFFIGNLFENNAYRNLFEATPTVYLGQVHVLWTTASSEASALILAYFFPSFGNISFVDNVRQHGGAITFYEGSYVATNINTHILLHQIFCHC